MFLIRSSSELHCSKVWAAADQTVISFCSLPRNFPIHPDQRGPVGLGPCASCGSVQEASTGPETGTRVGSWGSGISPISHSKIVGENATGGMANSQEKLVSSRVLQVGGKLPWMNGWMDGWMVGVYLDIQDGSSNRNEQ